MGGREAQQQDAEAQAQRNDHDRKFARLRRAVRAVTV
jgi:hypothetical protein